jgi:hypothetical protein
LHDKLNIYNIPNTVSQKFFTTNIQNNLHIIYNTPVYYKLVKDITNLEKIIEEIVNNTLHENNEYNKSISRKIMEDVIYNNIFYNIDGTFVFDVDVDANANEYENDLSLYNQLNKIIYHYNFIKDENHVKKFIAHIIDEIKFIISSFELHNKFDNHVVIKAYNFGSTSSVYKQGDVIIKFYNKRLRWVCESHKNSRSIFNKEIRIINLLEMLIEYNEDEMFFKMNHKGESLYNNFSLLPTDYKEQIHEIFIHLDLKNIYYPEFNINNILVDNENKISFIDFGLADINENRDNNENCKNFIELLEILENRFKNSKENQQILYNIFINNMKYNRKYPNNIF